MIPTGHGSQQEYCLQSVNGVIMASATACSSNEQTTTSGTQQEIPEFLLHRSQTELSHPFPVGEVMLASVLLLYGILQIKRNWNKT